MAKKKSNKRKNELVLDLKLPNGCGSIAYLGEGRRNPFIAKEPATYKTVKQAGSIINKTIRPVIGSYPNQISALLGLHNFHIQNGNLEIAYEISAMFPRGLNLELPNVTVFPAAVTNNQTTAKTIFPTFKEIGRKVLDDMWEKEKKEKLSFRYVENNESIFNQLEFLHSIPMNEINIAHIEDKVTKIKSDLTYHTALVYSSFIKRILSQGVKEQIVNSSITLDTIKLMKLDGKISTSKKTIFNDKEIKKILLDADSDNLIAIMVKMLLCNGMRIGELLSVEISSIFLADRYLIGGSKTDSGKNRIIPIHKDIHNIIADFCKSNKKYLIEVDGDKIKYSKARYDFDKYAEQNGFEHTLHETRHTFMTVADNCGLKDINIKKIVGHKSDDITKDVYTHKGFKELVKEIDKFKLLSK